MDLLTVSYKDNRYPWTGQATGSRTGGVVGIGRVAPQGQPCRPGPGRGGVRARPGPGRGTAMPSSTAANCGLRAVAALPGGDHDRQRLLPLLTRQVDLGG